jgi:hypothetical protein
VADHQHASLRLRERAELLRFTEVERERLLDKDMLAGIEPAPNETAVSLRGHGDHDRRNVRAVENRVEVKRRRAILRRQRCCGLRTSVMDRRKRPELMKITDEILPPIAAPDDCDFRHVRSPRTEHESDADHAPRRVTPTPKNGKPSELVEALYIGFTKGLQPLRFRGKK